MSDGWHIGVKASKNSQVRYPLIDTGSAVLALPMTAIDKTGDISDGHLPTPEAKSCLTYSSSGVKLVGSWVRATVSFFNKSSTALGTATQVPVLGVLYSCSTKQPGTRVSGEDKTRAAAQELCRDITPDDFCSTVGEDSELGMLGAQFGFLGVSLCVRRQVRPRRLQAE